MKVLVVGSGGREHALCWRLHQSQSVWGLFCTGANPGISQLAKPVAIDSADSAALTRFAADNAIDLTIIGPESPLAAGIVDEFDRQGLCVFGPTRAAAQLESSKAFGKTVMREAGVPTAAFEVFDEADSARRYVRSVNRPLVVKADGLALGKGVTVCDDADSALAAIAESMEARRFGSAGARLVIEEKLTGDELSFFALADGDDALPLGFVKDHKPIFDGDRGPNTGGMGAYSPVPRYGSDFEDRVMREVVRPTLRAMSARGTPFRGVLFAGLMVENGQINVLEFNARFGDPECEALMMRFDGDLAETLLAVAQGRSAEAAFRLSSRSAVSVVLASGGYPGDYRKGVVIQGLEQIEGGEPSPTKVRWAMDRVRLKVFHAGTALDQGKIVTAGGRVLAVTAIAADLAAAISAAYEAAAMIQFEGRYLRRDIGQRGLNANI
ncbi:MAG TPA: phosphoribosylamine--glycine ligase [Candidatus Binataceae bacterium]|nr:phosphoribosylamine--glycine ligase [Candidatus Binataceae bacterium]